MSNIIPNIYEAAKSEAVGTENIIEMQKREKRDLFMKKEISRAAYMLSKNYLFQKEALEKKAKEQLKNLCKRVARVVSSKGQNADNYVCTIYNGGGLPVAVTGTNWSKMRATIASYAGVKTDQIVTNSPYFNDEPAEYEYTNSDNQKSYYFVSKPNTINKL